MRDFDRSSNRMRRFVTFFIGFVFVLIVAWIGFIGFVGYRAIDTAAAEDWSGGIKPVLEKLWCGKPGCINN